MEEGSEGSVLSGAALTGADRDKLAPFWSRQEDHSCGRSEWSAHFFQKGKRLFKLKSLACGIDLRRLQSVNGNCHFVAVLVGAFSLFGGWLSILLLTHARTSDSHCLSPQICSFLTQNPNGKDSCCWFTCNVCYRGRFHCKRGPCTFLMPRVCVHAYECVCVLALLA